MTSGASRDPLQVRWARWQRGVLVLKTAVPGLYRSAVRRAMAAKLQAGQEQRGGDHDGG